MTRRLADTAERIGVPTLSTVRRSSPSSNQLLKGVTRCPT
jgi:hypothetical protein